MNDMFKPLKNERIFEQVVGSIQREILVGNLAPGQKLPNESDLAKQFRVGRSAIREALKVLELSGLLYVKRGYNGGTFVKPPDPDDSFNTAAPTLSGIEVGWNQLMEARGLVEVKTAELAASRATAEEIAELRDSLERMRAVLGKPALFLQEDYSFHLHIAEAARNGVFLVLISSLKTSLKRDTNRIIEQDSATQQILEDHHAIVDRIAARDPEGAGEQMAQHLASIESRYADEVLA